MLAFRAASGAVLVAIGALAVAAPAPAPAQSRGERQISSPITDRFALRGTFYSASVDTRVRLDASNALRGTPVLAEEDLGLDDRIDQGRLELMFRIRERHRLRADYFKIARFGEIDIARQINFGDQVFVPPELVVTNLDYRQLGFTYTYSPLKYRRFELGVGFGLNLVEASARGEARVRRVREEAAGVAPFPTIALEATWRISSRWSISGRGQYFSASLDEFDGSVADYHADVQYRWRRNLTVGLGYTNIRIGLDVADDEFPGEFNLDTAGPELFFRVSF
jgi:hypothetical protein